MDQERTGSGRPVREWAILLIAWAFGLAIWAIYIGMIIWLLYRWF